MEMFEENERAKREALEKQKIREEAKKLKEMKKNKEDAEIIKNIATDLNKKVVQDEKMRDTMEQLKKLEEQRKKLEQE